VSIHKNIRLLALFNFLLDFRLYAPVAILYFTSVSGSFALGMSVFSITMLASSLLEVPTGVFSDMIGRKRTMVCGAVASVASVTFYAIGGTYAMLVVGALFEGLARSFFSGNNDALLHDSLTESGQQEAFQEYLGKTASMYQAALAISAIAGSVIAAISFPAVMWLSVVPHVLGLLVTLRIVEPKVHSRTDGNVYAHLREAFKNTIQNPRLRALSLASILTYAIGEAAFHFRVAFIDTLWPRWAIGIARTMAAGIASISFYLSGRLIKRFGELKLLTVGITYSELINLFSLLIPTVLSPVLMGTTSIFFGVNTVAIGGLKQREFTERQRATMGSLDAFGGSITFAVISFLMGASADRFGVIPTLLVAHVFSLSVVLLYRKAFQAKSTRIPTVASEAVAEGK
jgi:MFS family permease